MGLGPRSVSTTSLMVCSPSLTRRQRRSSLVANAKLLRHAGALHPQPYKLGHVLMRFLFERGNQVAKLQIPLLPGIQHMANRISKHFTPILVLQRVKKQEALRMNDVRCFSPARLTLFWNQPKHAPDRFHARVHAFRGLSTNRRRECRKRGKRRILSVKSRVLRVAQPACSERRSRRSRKLRRVLVKIHHHGIRGNHLGCRRFNRIFVQNSRDRGIETREASRHHRTLHNPGRRRVLAAVSEHRVIRLDRSRQRLAHRTQARGILGFSRPEENFFFSSARLRGSVASRDYEGVRALPPLRSAKGHFSAAVRSFPLLAARAHQKSLGKMHAQFPSIRGHSTLGKETTRRQ